MSVLITAFSSFPGVAENVTEAFVRDARAHGRLGPETCAIVFPVSYDIIARRLDRVLDVAAPSLVIGLGAARRGRAIRLEAAAFNRLDTTHPDVLGRTRARVGRGGPARRATDLPRAAVVRAAAEAGVRLRVSQDPGGYVCGFTYYKLLAACAARGAACVFVHLPQRASAPATRARLFADVRALVGILEAHAPRATATER